MGLERLARPLTLADLAAHARMSVRTFTRRFREETGMSATQWLLQQRVSHARHLLETTDTPVERVATDAGFGTTASLRQHLHAAIGVAPLTYRRTFRGTARSPDVTCHSPSNRTRPGRVWLSTTYRRRPRSSGAAGIDVGLRLRHRGAPGCPTSRRRCEPALPSVQARLRSRSPRWTTALER